MNEESIKKAAEKFYEIRDIPYHIALDGEKDWSCGSKNKKLAKELEQLGYKTRERIALFRWTEQGLPKEALVNVDEDECSHLFLEVIPPGQDNWITVDATWNSELKPSTLPVAEWDGLKPTANAVKYYEIIPVEKNKEYLDSIDEQEDLKMNYKIYDAFNKYCDGFLEKRDNAGSN